MAEANGRLRGAITGIGELAPLARPDGRPITLLILDVARRAMLDAGLRTDEVDGLLIAPPLAGAPVTFPSMMAEYIGLRVNYLDLVDLGGASAAGMVWRAAAAISAGLCRNVLCVTAEVTDPQTFYSRGTPVHGLPAAEFDRPYGPMGANSGYALAARRHMYEFGTTARQLAKIAVDQRANACANPDALFYGRPLTIDDVLASPLIVDPLHLLEIVRPCTGAAALIVSGVERSPDAPHTPVLLLGAGERCTHSSIINAPSMTQTPIRESAARAFAMAGVGPQEIDLVSVYDCYTITVLLTLEDAGFCAKGEGGAFVLEHDLSYRGNLPVNTHGGQLSFGQPGLAGGMSHVTEAVRQLRGEAGKRQVPNCRLAFVNGNGGILSEQASLVLASG